MNPNERSSDQSLNESLVLAAIAVAYICQPLLHTSPVNNAKRRINKFFGNIGDFFKKKYQKSKAKKSSSEGKRVSTDKDSETRQEAYTFRDSINFLLATFKGSQKKYGMTDKQIGQVETIAAVVNSTEEPMELEKLPGAFEKQLGKPIKDWAKENNIETNISSNDIEKIQNSVDEIHSKMTEEQINQAVQQGRDIAKKKKISNKEEGEPMSIIDDEGKKRKVIIHTGPQGGRFYYSGNKHDDEHKVYIESAQICVPSLVEYLKEHIN